jgi:alpha-tubulin suppressor-like RCC1 family protein
VVGLTCMALVTAMTPEATAAVAGLTGVTAVAAGGHHSLALLSNGTVMVWGEDNYGQLGDGVRSPFSDVPVAVPGLSGVVAVTAGDLDSFAVLADGE